MPLVLLLAICLFGRAVEAQHGGDTGEPNDPYLIYTAEQMNAIGTWLEVISGCVGLNGLLTTLIARIDFSLESLYPWWYTHFCM